MRRYGLRTIECPLCGFTAKRYKKFEHHTNDVHDLGLEELWQKVNGGRPVCACGCGMLTRWNNWWIGYSHTRKGHSSSIYKVYSPEKAADITERRRQKLIGRRGWCSGLTKETDDRIRLRGLATSIGRKRAFEEGKLSIWSKGRTKDDDERLRKMSDHLREGYSTGVFVPWHRGLTEETDERVRVKSDSLRRRFAEGEIKAWHAGRTKEDDPRIAKFWQDRDPKEEYKDVRWSDSEIVLKLCDNKHITLVSIDDYRNQSTSSLSVVCRDCGWADKVSLLFALRDRCPKCGKKVGGSRGQSELALWVQSLGLDIVQNVRGLIPGRQELDVFIPSKMFALEFNGLYWHCSRFKAESYHQDKVDACRSVGISLLHVYEDDWNERQSIVRSDILSAIGSTPNVIDASDMEIVELNTHMRRDFFTSNCREGDATASRVFGLVDNEKNLLCVLSVRTLPRDRGLELVRFSCSRFINVRHGLSRLVDHTLAKMSQSRLLAKVSSDREMSFAAAGFSRGRTGKKMSWWTDGHSREDIRLYKSDEDALKDGFWRIDGCRRDVWDIRSSQVLI